jgi:hypothetical protein
LATLQDGTEVVVKVRRPNVVEAMDQDFEIIRNFAARVSRRSKAAARYELVGLADEFVQTLRAQLDYLQEARNAERFAANFEGDPTVQIRLLGPGTWDPRQLDLTGPGRSRERRAVPGLRREFLHHRHRHRRRRRHEPDLALSSKPPMAVRLS